MVFCVHMKCKNAYRKNWKSDIYIFIYEWIIAGYLIKAGEYRDIMQGISIIALT